jgi:hypothetical protein
MGKRGPPATPDPIKELRGTDRPDRAHPRVVPELRGEVAMPEWLEGLEDAAEMWRRKVAKYRARGMSVVGCEDQLAHYCAYDAAMIRQWLSGEEVTSTSMNVLNKYASQFYDTPAAQYSQQAVGAQKSETENFWDRFKGHCQLNQLRCV